MSSKHLREVAFQLSEATGQMHRVGLAAMTEQSRSFKGVSAFSPGANRAHCINIAPVALYENISEGLHVLPAGPSLFLQIVQVLTGLSLFSMFCGWM